MSTVHQVAGMPTLTRQAQEGDKASLHQLASIAMLRCVRESARVRPLGEFHPH